MNKKYKHKQTGEIYDGKSIVLEGKRIFAPQEQHLLAAGYEPYEEPVMNYEPTEEDKRQQRMAEIQAELAATDYLALKAFEGEDMTEHEGWKEKRKALREEYRRLEEKLDS